MQVFMIKWGNKIIISGHATLNLKQAIPIKANQKNTVIIGL